MIGGIAIQPFFDDLKFGFSPLFVTFPFVSFSFVFISIIIPTDTLKQHKNNYFKIFAACSLALNLNLCVLIFWWRVRW